VIHVHWHVVNFWRERVQMLLHVNGNNVFFGHGDLLLAWFK